LIWFKCAISFMVLYEVVFKVTHDCPFCNISKRFSKLKMFVWCNRTYEAVEVITEDPKEYSIVLNELSKIGRIIDESFDGHKAHMIIKQCTCRLENSVGKNIDDFNILHVSPVAYEKGWEYYRIVVFQHRDMDRFFQRLEDKGTIYKILRKMPFDGFLASSLTLTADALFANLTDKQVDSLMTAYRYGYYRLPRTADVKAIANKKRIPRTTFQEHLRKAESKLITSLIPYIQLFRQAPEEKRKSLKIIAK